MADEELGVALIVGGVLLMLAGIVFWPLCGLGILLVIVGIILALAAPPRHPYYAATGYPYQQPPPVYPYPSQPPAAGMPVPTAPGYAQPLCPVCGSPLSWIPQYGRWYCTRCQSYR